jgi:hypothetical protein
MASAIESSTANIARVCSSASIEGPTVADRPGLPKSVSTILSVPTRADAVSEGSYAPMTAL